MTEKDITYWRGEIKNGQDLMRYRAKTWQRLMDAYDLKYQTKISDLAPEDIVKLSRFYPLTRQLLATLTFNYPRVFIRVEQEDQEQAGDLLERAANAALKMMQAKREVQQILFDALYCTVGWLKFGVNPPGDDSVPPYTANDALEEDFPYVMRVNPRNILLDPLTPPHNLGMARYIIEQMWVPLEYLKEDNRYTNRGELKPYKGDNDRGLLTSQVPTETDSEEAEALRKAVEAGEMCLIYEIHDRLHKRRITFAEGVEQPIEDIEHPFGRVLPQLLVGLDGQPLVDFETGQPIQTGEYESQPGYIVENGFPYYALKFDLHGSSFYPKPAMEYVEDLQNVVVESVSRRLDILKRFRRVGVIEQSEVDGNPQVKDQLARAKDGEFVTVQNKDNLRELTWGTVPGDQINLESDARAYEEQTLGVTELQRGGDGPGTATEASLQAAAGSINREWMQDKVADAYRAICKNTIQIMADPRYTPENFVLNVAPEGQQAMSRALEQADFLFDFVVEVEAGSMQPLIEELDKAQAMELFNAFRNDPDIDQQELKKMVLASARKKDIDKMFSDKVKEEAVRAAQNENQLMMYLGQDTGVLAGQDHQTHLQQHMAIQQNPAFQGLAPMQQQTVMGLLQQHVAAHQQAAQQQVQGAKAPARSRLAGQPRGIKGRVQSNAQKTADTVAAEGVR